jgi:single-strand DNA-binding protein
MATRSLNKVMLIGNLTRDPELRYTAGGTSVATFTVATNRTYTDSSGNTTETAEFTSVVAWAKLGEICAQLLKKGSKVFVEGRLQTSSWQTKEGQTAKRTEVVITDMVVLSGSKTGDTVSVGSENGHESPAKSVMDEDVDLDASAFTVDFEEMMEKDEPAKKDDKDSNDNDDKKAKDTDATDTNDVPF